MQYFSTDISPARIHTFASAHEYECHLLVVSGSRAVLDRPRFECRRVSDTTTVEFPQNPLRPREGLIRFYVCTYRAMQKMDKNVSAARDA